MDSAFANVYSSKTDDELLVLAGERKSLTPEAQSALWAELGRRRLTDPHLLHRNTRDEVSPSGENPAFNFPAKVAAVTMGLAVVAMLLTLARVAAHDHVLPKAILVVALVWGPIFAALAWGTRRALRNRSQTSQRR
jgi:hypothetical protein